jgi:hypothetical protein
VEFSELGVERQEKMIKIHCATNLDVCRDQDWPTELPCKPSVGDSIVSRQGIKLEVCNIIFVHDEESIKIELHMPKYSRNIESIRDFSRRMERFKQSEYYPRNR